MLDMKFIRENTDVVRSDLEKRGDSERLAKFEALLEKDESFRTLKKQIDDLRRDRNSISKQINEAKKAGKDVQEVLSKAKEIPTQIKSVEEKLEALEEEMKDLRMEIPNILHESVPVGHDEEGNVETQNFGKKPEFDFQPKNHTEIIENLGIVELERAAKVAGSRFYYLKGDLAMLDFAIQKLALDHMMTKGFTPVIPPYMMNRESYEGVAPLADFEEVMYKVEDEDLYMIATSEHPLTAMYKDEVLLKEKLPVKQVGISPCFRKEVGSHGKEEKGIWRVHQFHKIEQIVICDPDESWTYHDELLQNAIEFFELLELHCRVINICTGDIGTMAAKKFDIEAWIPSVEQFKEVVSCSNCTAYQAVRLNLRMQSGGGVTFPHTLNSTCVATSRAMVALLEQHQQKDGRVKIPKALQPLMGGKEFIEACK